MSKVFDKALIKECLTYALGLSKSGNVEFANRVSATVTREHLSSSAIGGQWKLCAFVLDSSRTVIVSLDMGFNAIKPMSHGTFTYRIYAGPRELIYQVMKDFSLTESVLDKLPTGMLPSLYVDGLYADYALDDSAFEETPKQIDDATMADLSIQFQRDLGL